MVGQAQGNKIYVNHGLYLKKAVKEVGYIDEENYFFYQADTDLALKIWQKGYLIIESPNSYIEHFFHANLNVRRTNEKRKNRDWNNYLKKWDGVFYNEDGNYKSSWIEKEYNDESLTAKKFPNLSLEAIFNIKKSTTKNSLRNWVKSLIPKKYRSRIKQLINKKL